MNKSHSESITDYTIRAENPSATLNAAEETVKDSLFVTLVLKGLPDDYTPLVAVYYTARKNPRFSKF